MPFVELVGDGLRVAPLRDGDGVLFELPDGAGVGVPVGAGVGVPVAVGAGAWVTAAWITARNCSCAARSTREIVSGSGFPGSETMIFVSLP